jgi:hypothetical protein
MLYYYLSDAELEDSKMKIKFEANKLLCQAKQSALNTIEKFTII